MSRSGDIVLHRINCYHEILTGTGDSSDVLSRVLIIEDLSPAAVETLGAGSAVILMSSISTLALTLGAPLW